VSPHDEVVSDEKDGLAIGAFALLTGLSVPRLRRYHELGLLVPARIDPRSGYRSYSPDQVGRGRLVNRLRQADVPLGDLERIVTRPADALRLLRRHRQRLEDRIEATNRMVELVDQLMREERARMSIASLQIVEVILRVEDVEETVAFYRDVFEMEFQPDDHNGTLPVHYDACGGSWDPQGFFMFTIFPADGQPTRTNVGFGVPDLDVIWSRAQARGATEVAPPTDSGYMPRQAIFEDPAGNRVNVYHRGDDW
jgi:DNA-binding transcriptional MerR regulator